MGINTCISIITLNVNGLNAPTKRHSVAEWIIKQDSHKWGENPHPEKTEYSFERRTLCNTRFPHYLSLLGIHMYQCTSWLVVIRGCVWLQLIFFEDSTHLPIS